MALRIKDLRTRAGYTQQQLADMAGIERSQLSKIENEREPANTRRLAQIAKALGVDVADLFEGPKDDILRRALLAAFDCLPEDHRKAVLAHARALAGTKGDDQDPSQS